MEPILVSNYIENISRKQGLYNMSLIPVHEVGLFNVWLFYLPFVISWVIPYIFNKKAAKRLGDMSWWGPKEKKVYGFMSLVFYGSIFYSIWVPLQVGTIWLYIGLVVYITGVIF